MQCARETDAMLVAQAALPVRARGDAGPPAAGAVVNSDSDDDRPLIDWDDAGAPLRRTASADHWRATAAERLDAAMRIWARCGGSRDFGSCPNRRVSDR